jgi:hypothetical protein
MPPTITLWADRDGDALPGEAALDVADPTGPGDNNADSNATINAADTAMDTHSRNRETTKTRRNIDK